MPAGRPVRLQPLCQRRPVPALRGLVHLRLPARLPRPHLPAGRERVRPEPQALPERGHLPQRGRLLPLHLPRHPHWPPLRAPVRALQPLPLPEWRHLPPHGGHHPRVRLPARYRPAGRGGPGVREWGVQCRGREGSGRVTSQEVDCMGSRCHLSPWPSLRPLGGVCCDPQHLFPAPFGGDPGSLQPPGQAHR